MLLQLNMNVSSVPSELGRRTHGYVGAILLNVTYAALVSMAHFILTANPGDLTGVPGTAQ